MIHGGLFHRDGVTLAQLNKCNRPDFIAIPPVQARVGRERRERVRSHTCRRAHENRAPAGPGASWPRERERDSHVSSRVRNRDPASPGADWSRGRERDHTRDVAPPESRARPSRPRDWGGGGGWDGGGGASAGGGGAPPGRGPRRGGGGGVSRETTRPRADGGRSLPALIYHEKRNGRGSLFDAPEETQELSRGERGRVAYGASAPSTTRT